MANKVTLKQIAQEVGLSPSSVSLVLNNRPCRISEENRKLIKEVAARNHYVPNQIARSLVMRESRTLGLIVPNIESRFFASLAGSLEKRCREDGYALFITSSGGSADDDLELLRQLVTRGVDGVFLVVGDEFSDDRALREEVSHLPIPAVMVDRAIEGLECDKVMFDHEMGGYMATRYLIEQGHRRIACLVNARRSNTGRKRLAGYERALREVGLPIDARLEFESEYYIPSAYEASEAVLATDATAVLLAWLTHAAPIRVANDLPAMSAHCARLACLSTRVWSLRASTTFQVHTRPRRRCSQLMPPPCSQARITLPLVCSSACTRWGRASRAIFRS